MTTVAEIRRITTELRKRDPRWVVVKRMVVMQPVTHWLCGVYLHASSWEKGRFRLTPMVHPLAAPGPPWRIPVTGSDVRAPVDRGAPDYTWNSSWPNCPELLADVLQGDLQPKLEVAATPEGILLPLKATYLDFPVAVHGAFNCAVAGRLPEAKKLAQYILGERVRELGNERVRQCERLSRVLDRGQEATNRTLRRLERISARQFGVEKWWRWEPLVEA